MKCSEQCLTLSLTLSPIPRMQSAFSEDNSRRQNFQILQQVPPTPRLGSPAFTPPCMNPTGPIWEKGPQKGLAQMAKGFMLSSKNSASQTRDHSWGKVSPLSPTQGTEERTHRQRSECLWIWDPYCLSIHFMTEDQEAFGWEANVFLTSFGEG